MTQNGVILEGMAVEVIASSPEPQTMRQEVEVHWFGGSMQIILMPLAEVAQDRPDILERSKPYACVAEWLSSDGGAGQLFADDPNTAIANCLMAHDLWQRDTGESLS